MKKLIIKLIIGLKSIFQLLLIKNSFLSSIYYTLFSRAFYKEHRAVMLGIKKYNDTNLSFNSNTSAVLRKNIHGLEKGLIMMPRRDIFGLRYIKETVIIYKNAIKTLKNDQDLPNEIQWAHDVLTNYFEICGQHPIIDEAKNLFQQINSKYENKNTIPYKRDLTREVPVSYKQLYELALRRRSVRWYLNKKVEHDLIDKAISIANLSPSACNRQPFRYVFIEDKSTIRKISQLPFGTQGFYENIPGLALVIGRLDSYFDERDRHLMYIDSSLSVMSFLFALETQGLSSCVINWPDVNSIEKKVGRIIDLKPYERVIMLISYGYPDPEGKVAFSQKKPLEQIRSYF